MIIWLASYPKSGNTWVRAIISSLIYSKDGLFNFKFLPNISQFPLTEHFKDLTEDLDDLNNIKKFWVEAQEKINLNNQINFFKTHHMNCKIDGDVFTNKNNTLATIYIVRDPRNLVTSLSNHYTLTNQESKNFLLSQNNLRGKNNYDKLPVFLGTWQQHYKSWTTNNHNLLLIKYENLISDTENEIIKIIKFLKKFTDLNYEKNKIQNIIESTSFESLKKMEKENKFKENINNKLTGNKVNFFNMGKKNNWKDLLDRKLSLEIEERLNAEMKELGYL